MGVLFYGAGRLHIQIDDVLLAQVQIVVTTKLRRHETLILNWRDSDGGRSSVWITPATDLHYKYNGGRRAAVDRERLDALTVAANSLSGLILDNDTPAR